MTDTDFEEMSIEDLEARKLVLQNQRDALKVEMQAITLVLDRKLEKKRREELYRTPHDLIAPPGAESEEAGGEM